MNATEKVMRKARNTGPPWFWTLVCQEPFFHETQEGRDAILTATFGPQWPNPMLTAVRAVATSAGRSSADVFVALFEAHITSRELKARPQAQWKAAIVLLGLAASRKVSPQEYAAWVLATIGVKRPREEEGDVPDEELDEAWLQAVAKIDRMVIPPAVEAVVPPPVVARVPKAPRKIRSAQARQFQRMVMGLEPLPEGAQMVWLPSNTGDSLPEAKASFCRKVRAWSFKSVKFVTFSDYSDEHVRLMQCPKQFRKKPSPSEPSKPEHKISAVVFGCQGALPRPRAANAFGLLRMRQREGCVPSPALVSARMLTDRVNAWDLMLRNVDRLRTDILKAPSFLAVCHFDTPLQLAMSPLKGIVVQRVQGNKIGELSILYDDYTLRCDADKYMHVVDLDCDRFRTVSPSLLMGGGTKLLGTHCKARFDAWRVAAVSLTDTAHFEAHRGTAAFLERPHIFALQRFGVSFLLIVCPNEQESATKYLHYLFAGLANALHPRYYDWECRRWIKKEYFQGVRWEPDLLFTKTYDGPAKWVHRVIELIPLDAVSATADVRVSWGTSFEDEVFVDVVTCPVRGTFLPAIHSDLTPLIVSYLSVFDVLISLLHLRRRCVQWFSHWAAIRQCAQVQFDSFSIGNALVSVLSKKKFTGIPSWFATALLEKVFYPADPESFDFNHRVANRCSVLLRKPFCNAIRPIFANSSFPWGRLVVRPRFLVHQWHGRLLYLFMFKNQHQIAFVRILSMRLVRSILAKFTVEEKQRLEIQD